MGNKIRRDDEEELGVEGEEEQEILEQIERERQRQLQQELHIRTALNQQTDVQFKQYALQQFPHNPQQQQVLITTLQEQHFQQYMEQSYQQQFHPPPPSSSLHSSPQHQPSMNGSASSSPVHLVFQQNTEQLMMSSIPVPPQPISTEGTDMQGYSNVNLQLSPTVESPDTERIEEDNTDKADGGEGCSSRASLAVPSMWTRKDLKSFKESLRKDPDSLIRVGSGETVTVRVPTHEEGTCLFWEFATDSYDIGFGVYFEWSIAPNNQVSVHVSESSDEEDGEEEDVEGVVSSDAEPGVRPSKKDSGPPTDEIIPVYRRDCQDEVYCGSHMYPGQGVYLLKFDNSYSLWRSKTLYYRVYYTR